MFGEWWISWPKLTSPVHREIGKRSYIHSNNVNKSKDVNSIPNKLMIESVSLEPTCCSTLSSFYLFTCIIKTSNGPHTVYTLCFCTIILAHVATCNNCTYLCMVMHPFPPLLPQTRKLVGLHALVMILLLPRKQQFLRLLPQVTCTVGCVAWFACTCMI